MHLEIDKKDYIIIKTKQRKTRNKAVEFYVIDGGNRIVLTCSNIDDTQKKIQETLGVTFNDFAITTSISQHGNISLIAQSNNKIKEMIYNFLRLDIFEQLHKKAKEYRKTIAAELSVKKIYLDDKTNIISTDSMTVEKLNENYSMLQKIKDHESANNKLIDEMTTYEIIVNDIDRIDKQINHVHGLIKLWQSKCNVLDKYIVNPKRECDPDELIMCLNNHVGKAIKLSIAKKTKGLGDLLDNDYTDDILELVEANNINDTNRLLVNHLIPEIHGILKDDNVCKYEDELKKLEKIKNEYTQRIKDVKIVDMNALKNRNVRIQELKNKLVNEGLMIENAILQQNNTKQDVENLKSEIDSMNKVLDLAVAYEKNTSTNGLVFNLAAEQCVMIENKTNAILSNFSKLKMKLNFSKELRNIRGDIDIFKQTDSGCVVHSSLSSGYELMVQDLALKLTLGEMGKIKTNIFFLDEVFSCTDSVNINSIATVLNYMTTIKDAVLLVSHDETVKNLHNDELVIGVVNGVSKVDIGSLKRKNN